MTAKYRQAVFRVKHSTAPMTYNVLGYMLPKKAYKYLIMPSTQKSIFIFIIWCFMPRTEALWIVRALILHFIHIWTVFDSHIYQSNQSLCVNKTPPIEHLLARKCFCYKSSTLDKFFMMKSRLKLWNSVCIGPSSSPPPPILNCYATTLLDIGYINLDPNKKRGQDKAFNFLNSIDEM